MGWYSYTARNYTKHGTVDRRAECRKECGGDEYVIKDALVGSTYYAAVRTSDKKDVFIAVFLTSVKDKTEFSYKPMEASMGPYRYDCPESILKLNTLHDGYTDEWIAKCRELRAKKNEWEKLQKKVSVLRVTLPWDTTRFYRSGDVVTLTKNCTLSGKIYWVTSSGIAFGKAMLKELYETNNMEVIE